MVRRGR